MASPAKTLTSLNAPEPEGHIVPFATGQPEERNAHKPAGSDGAQEVSEMLGKDHAILGRIQQMRNEQLYDAAQRYWLPERRRARLW
jgi:hypothetical protein